MAIDISSTLAHTIEVVARSTASISLFSSILIIYVILLSRHGLSKPYHRILFGMSVFDIMGSTAIALTTLPMPTHYENEDISPWTGKRLGNTQTCTAQGFFVYLLAGSIGYNSMLSLYYFFIIGLQKEFRAKLEVALHVLVWTTTLVVALTPVILNSYRPNHELPWCAPGGPEGSNQIKSFLLVVMVISAMCFLTSVFSLLFVSYKVVKRNRAIRIMIQEQPEDDEDKLKKLRRDTNVVLIQCSCYVLALSLTVAACIIPTQVTVDNNNGHYILVVVALLPLQGFFDCLIFIGGKVVALKNAEKDLTILGALLRLFCHRTEDPIFLSNISMVLEELRNAENESPFMFDVENRMRRESVILRENVVENNNDHDVSSVNVCQVNNGSNRSIELVSLEESNKDQSLGGFQSRTSHNDLSLGDFNLDDDLIANNVAPVSSTNISQTVNNGNARRIELESSGMSYSDQSFGGFKSDDDLSSEISTSEN